MKKFLKIAGVLALLVVVAIGVGVWWVFHNIDSLAKRGIEQGGTYALGVPTTVDRVSLGIFSGDLSLSRLNVANPQGFASPHFLTLGSGDVKVTVNSLNQPVIDVPTLHLKGIDVNLEKGSSGANYQKILDSLARLKGSSKPSAPGSADKRLIIHDLAIDDVNIHVNMLGAPGQVGAVLNSATKLNVPIDHIQLKNVGQTGSGVGGSGVTPEELTSIIVQAVMAAAVDKGGGIIPGDILGDLRGGISSLGGLADIPVSVIGKAGETATQLGQKAVEGVGKAVEGVGKQLGDGLSNLLGGGKKDEKKDPPKKP